MAKRAFHNFRKRYMKKKNALKKVNCSGTSSAAIEKAEKDDGDDDGDGDDSNDDGDDANEVEYDDGDDIVSLGEPATPKPTKILKRQSTISKDDELITI